MLHMLKILSSLIGCLLLMFGNLSASDFSYRVIGEDQLWQGEVKLQQPILVATGATLSIAPGSRISVAEKTVGIRVEGRLLAVGRADAPIRFATPPGWHGIELYQSDGMNRFEYLEVESAEIGLSSSLSRFEMKQSRFRDCQTAIKLQRQSVPLIAESEFVGNQLAIDIGTRTQVQLLRNSFVANATAVMASHNSSGALLDNQFRENRQAVQLQHLFPGQLSGNLFENNQTGVLCDQTMNSPQIDGNHFLGNQRGVVSLLASRPQIRHNRFETNAVALANNQLGSPMVGQNLFRANKIAISNERRSAPKVERNRFETNEIAMVCDYLSYPQVKQNNFVDNRLAVKLGDHQSAAMEQQGVSEAQLQKFLAVSGKTGKMAIFSPASGVVDVSDNWWGGDVSEEAERVFYARQQAKWVLDDSSGERYLRDQIIYSPWLQQPVANAGPD